MCDYCDSCQDYMEFIKRPMPHLNCGDWNQQFSEWSALQVWVYIVIGLIWIIITIYEMEFCTGNCRWTTWGGEPIGTLIAHYAVGVLIAYINAHFGWWIIVRHGGLADCLGQCIGRIICIICGILYFCGGLNWGNFAWSGAFAARTYSHMTPGFAAGVNHTMSWEAIWLRRILYGIYAICLLYMGVASFMLGVTGQNGDWSGGDDYDDDYATRSVQLTDMAEKEKDEPEEDQVPLTTREDEQGLLP